MLVRFQKAKKNQPGTGVSATLAGARDRCSKLVDRCLGARNGGELLGSWVWCGSPLSGFGECKIAPLVDHRLRKNPQCQMHERKTSKQAISERAGRSLSTKIQVMKALNGNALFPEQAQKPFVSEIGSQRRPPDDWAGDD